MNSYAVLAIGSALVALALGLDELKEWRNDVSTKAYTKTRTQFLRDELSNAQPVVTLVLGDSISAMTWLGNVCGTTFNASVAGARIGDVAALAPYAIERTRPKVIVLEVGTNHFHSNPNLSDFERQYVALVRSLPGKKILVGVPNSSAASSFVRRIADRIGAAYVEPATGNLTNGGAHPTSQGAAVYRQRIERACVSQTRPL